MCKVITKLAFKVPKLLSMTTCMNYLRIMNSKKFTLEMIEDSSNTLGLLHYGESIVHLWT
jgi:hypothetical protein